MPILITLASLLSISVGFMFIADKIILAKSIVNVVRGRNHWKSAPMHDKVGQWALTLTNTAKLLMHWLSGSILIYIGVWIIRAW